MADLHSPKPSAYYQHSGSVPLASKISYHIRQKMFRMFMERFKPGPATTILDVGVTSDALHPESNFFERLYPYPKQITCIGTEDGSHLMQEHAGLKYLRVLPGATLPFRRAEFDIVFSNAVLEHVGSRSAQKRFLEEICRVGKAFFVTTPNRWFPVEHHTGLPFLHYLPAPVFREIIKNTRYRYWASESRLNILTARDLLRLFPSYIHSNIERVSFAGVTSNLVAYGNTGITADSGAP